MTLFFVHSYQTGIDFAYIKRGFDITIHKNVSASFWIRFASDEKNIISKVMFIFASMCVSKIHWRIGRIFRIIIFKSMRA